MVSIDIYFGRYKEDFVLMLVGYYILFCSSFGWFDKYYLVIFVFIREV